MTALPVHVLDPRQQVRIESVHRGFLYQHLYTVGCLLLAARSEFVSVVVERDEDIEIVSGTGRLYIQVKTRAGLVVPSDIKDAWQRFDQIRTEHRQGNRVGVPRFLIVLNNSPSPQLMKDIQSDSFPMDVDVLWPGRTASSLPDLPPAWPNVAEAARWCTEMAASLPFAMLIPDTLVWKAAGRVQAAASSSTETEHTFVVSSLPELFEQLIIQMQDFPAPPPLYRPQINEPELESGNRIRLICGFSGAGKTAWVSQAVMHASTPFIYYDVGDLPGPTIAASLVREIAAKLITGRPEDLQRILLPGASGQESLRLLDIHLTRQGFHPTVVLDNAHRVPIEHLCDLLRVSSGFRFVLLCQPDASLQELEARMAIQRESLQGWHLDDVAAEVALVGAAGSVGSFQRLHALTGGMPFFVQSAIRVAMSEFAGDIGAFCQAIDSHTSLVNTAQEIILSKVIESTPGRVRDLVAILSQSDIGLALEEVKELMATSAGFSEAETTAAIRLLRPLSVLQVVSQQHLKIHDAIRVLGKQHFELFDPTIKTQSLASLKTLLLDSLVKHRDSSKFSSFIRVAIKAGDIPLLVGLAGEEMFHEMGVMDEVWVALENALASSDMDATQQFWARDGLAFAALRTGDFEKLSVHLDGMEALLHTEQVEPELRIHYAMKRMLHQAEMGNAIAVFESVNTISEVLPDKPEHQRIFRYNAAHALWRLKQYDDAERVTRELIDDYYDVLGLSFDTIIGRNSRELRRLIQNSPSVEEDIKRFADTLELCAMSIDAQNRMSPFLRIHALKFYEMVAAVDSLIRVSQDIVDEFVARQDFQGAKQAMEETVLRYVTQFNVVDRMISARSQYAVVLAHCRDYDAAEAEMQRLAVYTTGLSDTQRGEIENQRQLIANLKRRLPSAFSNRLPGRNEPCPCGSGLKFKKCHAK